MKFNEKEKVAALMKDIINSGRNKENKIIEDLTEEQARELLTQYSGFSRILSAFPQTLLSNTKFLLSITQDFDVYVGEYANPVVFNDIKLVDAILTSKRAVALPNDIINGYKDLSKKPSYLLALIVKLFNASQAQGYSNVGTISLIKVALNNNDLPSYQKDLSLLLKKLVKADNLKHNSILQKMNQSSARKLIALLDDCAEAEKEVEAIHNQQEIDEDPIETAQ